MSTPRPKNEQARLDALHQLRLLDTEAEEAYDQIAALAQDIFDVRAAGVGLIDEDREWFKAKCGLSFQEIPRDRSFCTHVVHRGEVMVVEDAREDERFVSNPLVERGRLRFYAGAPVTVDDTYHVGTLCINDPAPRSFSEKDTRTLRRLARVVSDLIESRRQRHQVQYLRSVLEQVDDPVLVTEAEPLDPPGPRIAWVNASFCRMTGYGEDELLGVTPRMLQGPETDREVLDRVRSALEEGRPVREETVNYRKDGTPYVSSWTITPVRDETDTITHWASVQRDVTEQRSRVQDLEYRVAHDPLTNVLTRSALEPRLRRAFASEEDSTGAVLFLDLDRFKQINDTLGHQAGDEVLVAVAERIRDSIRSVDEVARLGGDEFVVWLPSVKGEEEATRVATRVKDRIRQPLEVQEEVLHVEASMGVVPDVTGHDSAEAVLSAADTAMYRSKRTQGQSITVYDPSMTAATKTNLQLDSALHRAVKKEAFEPYFLPMVDLETGRLVGFEALARWCTGDGVVHTPGTFLEVAETTGLIVPIGHQVIEKACGILGRLQERYGADLEIRLSGNFSRREFFQEDTEAFVADVLERHEIPPSRFTMEITERIIEEEGDQNWDKVQALDELGIRMEVDDFGTGFSSFQTLLQFPIDGLKVDRSLISDLPDDERATQLLRSVVQMGRRLDLSVTMEGIETKAQARALCEFDCPYGQGYLFSPPVPADALNSLIEDPPWSDLWAGKQTDV